MIDPLLDDDRADMVAALDELCAKHIDDAYLARLDRDAVFPAEIMQVLREQGWSSMVTPVAYGGSGASASDLTLVLEVLARHSLVVSQAFFSMWIIGAAAIAGLGDEQQKQEWLPRIADSGALVGFALTEPEAGSDAASLSTMATRVDGGWRVSGQKVFITGAAVSDVIITAVRTSRKSNKRDGITTILLDPKADGVSVRPLAKMGLKGIDLCEIFLEEVLVPDSAVLGAVDGGWAGVLDGLALERACLAAISTGATVDVLRRSQEHAAQRITFGKPLTSHQLIAQKLVEMRVSADAGRGLYRRAAELIDRGHAQAASAASVAKLFATRSYISATRDGVQIFGGYGFTDDYPVSRHYRDAKYLEIGGGSSEIQTIIIARSMGMVV